MKQVIVRIRDCRPTYTKTIAKYYFLCVSSYEYDVMDCIKTLLPGQEIWIKVGNLYSKYISYEELMENSQIDGITMEEELYNNLKNDYSLNYYMKEYLPQY